MARRALIRWTFVLGLALAASPVVAQSLKKKPAAVLPPSDQTTLLALEDSWTTGLVKRDVATFQRLLAPGFLYTENDKLYSRDDVLKDVATTTDTVRASRNEDMKVWV